MTASPKRRWPGFSLRTLFWSVILVAGVYCSATMLVIMLKEPKGAHPGAYIRDAFVHRVLGPVLIGYLALGIDYWMQRRRPNH
jgi:hypothetical protein